jgi:hypothetical protein
MLFLGSLATFRRQRLAGDSCSGRTPTSCLGHIRHTSAPTTRAFVVPACVRAREMDGCRFDVYSCEDDARAHAVRSRARENTTTPRRDDELAGFDEGDVMVRQEVLGATLVAS